MKKNMKLFVVLVITIIFSLLIKNNKCYASEEKEELIIIGQETDKEAKEYIIEKLPYIIYDIVKNTELYGVEIKNTCNLRVGNGFIIYNCDESIEAVESYYFPLIYDDTIIAIINITKNDSCWSMGASKEYVDAINKLDRKSKYIIYYNDKNIYAINEFNKVVLIQGEETNSIIKQENIDYAIFVEGKKEINILENNTNNEIMDTVFKLIYEEYQSNRTRLGFSQNTYFVTKLDMTNRLVNQRGGAGIQKNMCWAACVATIVRYRQNTSTLTAVNVCDLMNIDYMVGGTKYQAASALSKYKVNYYVQDYQSSWDQVVNSINNQYPIYMSCFSSGANMGHAVTLIGYSTNGGIQLIYFWNPGTETIQSVTYNSNGSVFSYGGLTYKWSGSLYYNQLIR